MMQRGWDRVCCASPGHGCERRYGAVAESSGITAYSYCNDTRWACKYRTALPAMAALGKLHCRVIMAGYRHQVLLSASIPLYCLLPEIEPHEFAIILAWAQDYTRRGIPWAVVVNGQCFQMWKLLRGG